MLGRRLLTRDDGQSLVEYAFASLFYLLIIFGTIEFGIAIWRYNMVTNLAQEGARWAAVHGTQSTAPASTAQVQTYVQGRSPGFTVSVTTTPAAPSTLAPGTLVTVNVQTTSQSFTSLLPIGAMTFGSTATMIMSR